MSKLVPPHGGRLNFLFVEGEEREEEMERAKELGIPVYLSLLQLEKEGKT